MNFVKELIAFLESLKLGRGVLAIIGLVVAFFIAIALNGVAGLFGFARLDMTENKVHTLSKGTKNILKRLETPVTVRYYATDDGSVMSPGELARARRVEEKLDEFVRAAPIRKIEIADPKSGKFVKRRMRMLQVEKLNPEPNTDAEDSAAIDNMQPVLSRETNNQIFMGLSIKCIEKAETMPWIDVNGEETLEYDLISAISSVHDSKTKKITVMTSLSVAGGMSPGGMPGQPEPAWAFYRQTGERYEVEVIDPSTKEIPSDTSCLVVLHPHDITDDGEYAIDQYLLNGGNVLALVDPFFFYARALGGAGQPQMPGMPPQQGPAPTSTLDKLFKAWGVTYQTSDVLVDLEFASEILRRGNFSPAYLTLTDQAIGSKDAPITQLLNNLNMLAPGAFDIQPVDGIKVDGLLMTSLQNKFVTARDADPTREGSNVALRQGFVGSGISRPLIAQLSGSFKTAFPEGDPSPPEAEADDSSDESKDGDGEGKDKAEPEAKAKPVDNSLKESAAPGQVVLIADVDFIFDLLCIQRQGIPGLGVEMVNEINQNLTLVQNAIEIMSGDPDLVNVRSRNTVRRPFTRQNEWLAEAEQKFTDQLSEFRKKEQDAQNQLNDLLNKIPGDIQEKIRDKKVQKEITKLRKDAASFSKQTRELQKDVTREFKRKQSFFKLTNFLGMPITIMLAGIGLAVYRRTKTAAR